MIFMTKKLLAALVGLTLMTCPLLGMTADAEDTAAQTTEETIQTEQEEQPGEETPEEPEEPEPHEHNFKLVSKTEPNCVKSGAEFYRCECGESYTVTIEKLGHSYTAIKTVKPTTTAQGYTLYRCTRCGNEVKKDLVARLTDVSTLKVTGVKASYSYTGKAISPAPVIKNGTKTLTKGTDYTLAYSNNTKKGTAKLTVTGKGKYAGTKVITYKITAASIKSAKVTGIKSCKKYTGKKITQNIKVTLGGKTLKLGTDYTVTYKNNVDIGKAQIIIKGKGNYSGSLTKKFKIVRMGWFKYKGNYYYYSNLGKKYVSGEYKIGNDYYYFSKNGIRQYGWVKVGSNYRLYDRLSGKRAANTTADGVRINKKGNAVIDDWASSKIATSIKAKKILKSITSPTDTMDQKRLKAFNWVLSFPYHQYRLLRPIYRQQGWEMTFANDIFDNHQGCCVAESAAIAFLFREIGYTDVYVCHDTGHSWVTIGQYLYDPVFAEAKSFSSNYGVIPTDYRVNPVDKRFIG